MKLELISFKLCPFVQRLIITLNFKKIPYTVTYINIGEPPDWFNKLSPLGKVPVLKVDNEVLFESAVINEFLDETSPGSLLAEDAVIRAKQRAWIEFSSSLNLDFYKLAGIGKKDEFFVMLETIGAKLARLQDEIGDGAWFGADISLLDFSVAPFFMRMELIKDYTGDFVAGFPRIKRWSDNLLELAAVKQSVSDDFYALFAAMLERRGCLAG